MKEDQLESRGLRNNPIFAIGVAIAIAIVMVMISFIGYYRSPTRITLENLQENNRELISATARGIKSGPIIGSEITNISKGIEDRILKLDDQADYNSTALTDSSLGL